MPCRRTPQKVPRSRSERARAECRQATPRQIEKGDFMNPTDPDQALAAATRM